jgi:ribosomal protein L37AE/L43A
VIPSADIQEIFDSGSDLTPIHELPPSLSLSTSPLPTSHSPDIKIKNPKTLLDISTYGLVNPFRKKLGVSMTDDHDLIADWNQIKQQYQSPQFRIGEPSEVSAIRPSTSRRIQIKLLKSDPSVGRRPSPESDDNCSACLGTGELLCCDTCPRVFHLSCVAEGFDNSNAPEGAWQCRNCYAKDSTEMPDPELGIFSSLLYAFQFINPRVFELPKYIRDSYEHVFSHPITGEYMDDREVDILPAGNLEVPRLTKKSTNDGKFGALSSKVRKVSEQKDASEVKNKNMYATCFKCARTDLKILQTSFLKSYTIPDLKNSIQSQRSELIQCDYCKLYWHLDCLDPPLVTIPHELREDEIPIFDIKAHSQLKARLWTNCSPLDPVLHLVPSLPARSSYRASDMQYFNSCDPNSEFLTNHRFIKIRSKWMCPCHAEWEVPKSSPKIKLAVVDLPPVAGPSIKRPVFKVIYNEPGKISRKKGKSVISPPNSPTILNNNGRINIQNDRITPEELKEQSIGLEYSIPESRIEFEFFRRMEKSQPLIDYVKNVKMDPLIEEKLGDYGTTWDSKVEELYDDNDVDLNHVPLVNSMVADEPVSPELREVNFY